MTKDQESLADRATRLSKELKDVNKQLAEQISRCQHEFSQPYQVTRPRWDTVIDGIEPHGSDPITRYHMVESREKEYGWERRCVKCGLTQYTAESKPVTVRREPVF